MIPNFFVPGHGCLKTNEKTKANKSTTNRNFLDQTFLKKCRIWVCLRIYSDFSDKISRRIFLCVRRVFISVSIDILLT